MDKKIYTAHQIVKHPHIMDMDTAAVFDALKTYGVVMFRDCFQDLHTFTSFVKKHSSKLSLDPGRTIEGGVAQLVDAGMDAVGLHCENGNAPIWPDLTWFYCQNAPKVGSQTTLCDGQSVLRDLSAGLAEKFRKKPIRYRRTVPGDKWRRIVCHYNPSIRHMNDVKFSDLVAIISSDPGTSVTYHEKDDCVSYAFVVSAIQTSVFSDKEAFANSILGPSFNYEKPVIDFYDGERFAPSLLEEVEEVSARHTHRVGWRDGDVVMIDNRRVMHGRERIVDSQRTIFNALSYR